jgi:hypothetical protein
MSTLFRYVQRMMVLQRPCPAPQALKAPTISAHHEEREAARFEEVDAMGVWAQKEAERERARRNSAKATGD